MSAGSRMSGLFIGWAEGALNQALGLDAAARQDLLALLAEPVTATVDPPGLTVQLQAEGDRLGLTVTGQRSDTLALAGSALAFASLMLGDREVFAQGRIEVNGDVTLAQQLQAVINRLEPDWEAALAARIGDVPAHFLGRRVREAIQWSRRAHESLLANVEEYLHEETRTLPPRAELDARFQDIDDLRLAVDRLEARTARLEASNSENSGQQDAP